MVVMERTRFNQVLADQRHRVFGHALRCLRDRHDAEDATQEVFLRLWRSGPDLDDDRIAAWLMSVTHNLCIDRARRAQARRKHFGDPDPAALDTLADAAPPHPLAAAEPDHPELEAALAALPVASRSLLLQHYWQGRRLGEIAASLGVRESTLKVRLHRARKTLRGLLDRCQPPTAAVRQEQG